MTARSRHSLLALIAAATMLACCCTGAVAVTGGITGFLAEMDRGGPQVPGGK